MRERLGLRTDGLADLRGLQPGECSPAIYQLDHDIARRKRRTMSPVFAVQLGRLRNARWRLAPYRYTRKCLSKANASVTPRRSISANEVQSVKLKS